MANKSYRYQDPIFSSYGKKSAPQGKAPSQKKSPFSFSLDKLNSISKDDYIILFLIFILIKDNKEPDWPLIFALGYILLNNEE